MIAAYARACNLLGAPGSGQLAKMVNQICIAGLVQGLSEGLHFAQKAGLDIEKLIATISKGAAQSWQMENRYKTMTDGKFDFGFAVDWMRKDLGICLAEARRNGAQSAGHRAGRPVLFRSADDGRQALGYVEPDRAAQSLAFAQRSEYRQAAVRSAILTSTPAATAAAAKIAAAATSAAAKAADVLHLPEIARRHCRVHVAAATASAEALGIAIAAPPSPLLRKFGAARVAIAARRHPPLRALRPPPSRAFG